MKTFSLDIIHNKRQKPFINIEVQEDKILIGAYECGKIARKLFYFNKQETEQLIKGLMAANNLIK